MKHEKKLKKYEVVWTCDFCGKESKSKKISDIHELKCIKNPQNTKFLILVGVLLFIGVLFCVDFVVRAKEKSNFIPQKIEEATATITPTPTPKPKTQNTSSNTNSSQIECIGPDGKHFNTSMTECKNLAEKWGKPVDYMVNCNYPPECGGGIKREPNSECEKPCTRISGNSNNLSSNSGNKVQFTSTQGIVDGTYYCYENRVNELTRYEQLISLKESTAKLCTESYKPTLDSCVNACNNNPDFSSCIKPCYDQANDACISKYEEVGNLRKEYMKKIYEICP